VLFCANIHDFFNIVPIPSISAKTFFEMLLFCDTSPAFSGSCRGCALPQAARRLPAVMKISPERRVAPRKKTD
jgi:hypothetical protein